MGVNSALIHLRTHSCYSFLNGLPSPRELAQKAAGAGMEALALTDRWSLSGAVEFYDACQSRGVRPILGLELSATLSPDLLQVDPLVPANEKGDLSLLAMDLTGWSSLCRLSSAAQDHPFAEPGRESIPFELLAQYNEGLICMTGGRSGLATRLLLKGHKRAAAAHLHQLREIFTGRLYVELQKHTPADAAWLAPLASIAQDQGLPLVATHQVHYLSRDQAGLQQVLAAIRCNLPLKRLPPEAGAPPEAYFTTEAEMIDRFGGFLADRRAGARGSAAITATREIAGRCRLELPLGIPHYPSLPLLPGANPLQVLQQKALEGARRIYPRITPQIQARLDHELDVIGKMGYASLFLVMEEIVQFAYKTGVPISSRGSAASSLVAHCLGLTSPDPIELNLYFERFLNPARATPPDIDTDLCSRRRDSVINFVYERYGKDQVAMVSTVNRFRRRSGLREVAKAYGLPASQVKAMADEIPHRYWGPPMVDPGLFGHGGSTSYAHGGSTSYGHGGSTSYGHGGSTPKLVSDGSQPCPYPDGSQPCPYPDGSQPCPYPDGSQPHPYAGLIERYTSSTDQAVFRDAAGLIGLPHHLSVHPGGVVIAPGPLTGLVPTYRAAKGIVVTQFDLESIERLGLVKIDLLGIRGLTVLGDVAEAIWLESGKTEAESDAGDRSKVRPSSGAAILDVLEAIPARDPAVADLLRNGRTIGCFQIESPGMRATLKEIRAESQNDLMIALALYRPGPLTGGLKDAFVRRHRGQEEPNYLHPALQPLLVDTHGVILYQEQVLRIAHELAGFSLGDSDLLRRAMSHFDPGKQMQTLKEKFIAGALQRKGVPTEVSERTWELMAAFSGYGFPKAHAASYAQVGWRAAWCKTHEPAVFMAAVLANWGGFYSQRIYLTEARRLGLAIRPPHVNYAQEEFSLTYLNGEPVLFMGLNQVRSLTRRTQRRMIQSRPFHSLVDFLVRVDPRPVEAENLVRAGALAGLGMIPNLLKQLAGERWRGGQLPLFSFNSEQQEQDWSLREKVAAQEAILGAAVDAHPLELVAGQIAQAGALTTVEAAALVGERVRVAGMRQTWGRTGGRGGLVYFMSFEDLEGMLEVVIPADVYRRHKAALSGPGPYLLEGTVEIDVARGEPVIRAERAWALG